MKNKLKLLILFIGISGIAAAGHVPKDIAEKVAKNFYHQRVNVVSEVGYADINPRLANTQSKHGADAFYIFEVNKDAGFVLVSADNAAKPVLAYAFEGEFNSNNMHPGQEDMLSWYAEQIAYLANENVKAEADVSKQWQELINYSPEKSGKNLRNVDPMMLAEWNQGYPYNQLCPEDAGGLAGHVPVGCVATAMVQVMKHWDYPQTGTGSKSHSNWMNGGYGNITVNFADQTYNWENMPFSGSGLNDDLALINFHAGVAVGMYWGAEGSGASAGSVPNALKNYFRYDENAQQVDKNYYGDEEYKTILREQLDNGLPMVYSGSPQSGAGHAWNCDGYLDDEFHMNWGWGGGGNGYYTLDNLVSSATPGGDDYNFIYDQEVTINIYPESDYPAYCTGSKTISGHQGAFGDGSADENYQNNSSCEYLISPECGEIIDLGFERFDLAEGDVVHIYDGATNDAPLLASFDMDNLPGNTVVRGTKAPMLIEFLTDGSGTAGGWNVSFDSDYCKTNINYTEPTGTVSDGSGECDYKKSTVCTWYIEPDGAESIALEFTEFDLGGSIDYLQVYANGTSDLVEEFNAENVPDELVVNAPLVYLQFYTDSDDDVGAGWSLNYELTSSIDNAETVKGVSLFPNPANEQVNLAFSLSRPSMVEVEIYDMLGKTIGTAVVNGNAGYQKIDLSSLINLPESGIFLVDITANEETLTKKLSILKQ
ncbi:MAG: C10 family peptidase [Bacteroidota bacterium]